MTTGTRTIGVSSFWVRFLSGPVVGVVVIALIEGGSFSSSASYSIALAAVYGIVVLSVSLLAGWGGVWSVGHPALLAVGAYTAAWGSTHHWGLELTIIVAAGLSAVGGALIGFAGARFSVLYIALLTLAFDLVILELVNRFTTITGGDEGVPVTPLPSKIGLGGITSSTDTLIWPVGVFAFFLAVTVAVRRTSLRMRLVAAKSHPLVSRTVGIAPEAQVALAFAVSGAVTAVAGVLLGSMSGFVSPDPFGLTLAINVIAAAVLGGIGSTAGAVVGGAFMSWSGTIAGWLHLDAPVLQGLILIVLLLFLPRGVVPSLRLLSLWALQRLFGRRTPASETGTGASAQAGRAVPAAEEVPPSTSAAAVTGEPFTNPAGVEPGSASSGDGVLDLRGVRVRFSGLVALRDVSLSLRRGEVLGVIGPNGAGKTTMLNTLSGVAYGGKVGGAIDLEGQNLRRLRPVRRYIAGLGRTFQHAELFSELTVLENLLCTTRFAGRKKRAEAKDQLARLGIADVANKLPAELAFGVRKQVDLARATMRAPKVLLMDEPFGGLDHAERDHIRAQIRRLTRSGTSVLIIDHVLDDLFSVTDRVVAFDFGTPLAEGFPQDVLRDDRVRAAYLGDSEPLRTSARNDSVGQAMVQLSDVSFHYGGVSAVEGINLSLYKGQVLGIVGANGAGKSTLGRIIGGATHPSSGTRTDDGARCSIVPEGRALFRGLSVKENLEVGAFGVGLRGRKAKSRVDEMVQWLPEQLHDRVNGAAGSLSGGEQQMLAIARGLVGDPNVLVLDEPSLGLAPLLVDEVYRRIAGLAEQGLTVVLLEQLLARAASVCDHIVVVRDGRIVAEGRGDDQAFLDRAERAYFGEAATELLEAQV